MDDIALDRAVALLERASARDSIMRRWRRLCRVCWRRCTRGMTGRAAGPSKTRFGLRLRARFRRVDGDRGKRRRCTLLLRRRGLRGHRRHIDDW